MTIYIGNIPYNMKEQNLIDVFKEFGSVESAKVIVDKKPDVPKAMDLLK